MKVRTLEQLLNVVFPGCIAAILFAACSSMPDTPSGETGSLPPPEPVATGESAARSPVILEEAVSRPRAQPTAGAGVAANRSGAIGVAAIEEVFVGERIRVVQDPLPVEAQAGEELWIIATPTQTDQAIDADDDTMPGTGAMLASFLPDEDEAAYQSEIPLPLKHTDVQARIAGYVGTVDVTQQFENPFDRKIEAVYVFPLPEKAAISEFVMSIGERRIRGILREREEAEAIYSEARAQGYQASLLVQHRPNIFEQKVANIEPGHRIDVNIQYFHTLAYRDGWYSFAFPTVVGPRFNPPGSTDPVAALSRSPTQPDTSGVAAQYLRPGERSGHDIGISVELDAGVEIEAIEASHFIDEVRTGEGTAMITLANRATIPNRDFVLDFKVAGGRIKSRLLTYEDPDEPGQGYFTMMLFPPAHLENLARHPVEMVFVLDCSGSMSGVPIAQAKSAVVSALDQLESDDTFQIIRFSDNASRFGVEPVAATPGNIERAKRYVDSLDGAGGTMMIEGIRAALNFPHDPERLRFVTFLTDGYIGNEAEILRAIHGLIGESRIFSFGVGSSVNRYLLERMAIAGRGAVAYLGLNDSGSDVMNDFFDRISHSALSNVTIRWGDMRVGDVYPSRLPDLYVGRPVVVTGKYRGEPGGLYVGGWAGGERIEFGVRSDGDADAHAFLPRIWARLRIADLMDRRVWATDPYGEFEGMIRQTALDYGLLSDYTAFVAVDASQPTTGDYGVTVVQPVPVPEGVRYETTIP
ncbi:MAG: VWA domain-containing protein [Proteobacteria bacterium]|nr:VWA domain-containing protein [Pseudomonadota bacterium]